MHVCPMTAVIMRTLMWTLLYICTGVVCIVVLLHMIIDSLALVDALDQRWFERERELLHLT